MAAATSASPITETAQLTWWCSSVTGPARAVIGSTRARPSRLSSTPPTHIAAHDMAIGGSGSPASDAEMTKYTARPTAAIRPQATPARLSRAEPDRSSTRPRPARAVSAPAVLSQPGRCPCRSHIQPTTSTTPRYSSSSATPTGIRCTASKKHSWAPATANTPKASTCPPERRSWRHRPRRASTPGTVRISAATAIRASTAAAGLQPPSISEVANVPEVPNVAADTTARTIPVPPRPSPRCRTLIDVLRPGCKPPA